MSYILIHDFKEQILKSPDENLLAEIHNVREFQMSGPVYGDLNISNSVSAKNIGVSICWSNDSKFLAAPELDPSIPEFKIIIFNIGTKKKRYASGCYGPVAIKEFIGDKIFLVNLDK